MSAWKWYYILITTFFPERWLCLISVLTQCAQKNFHVESGKGKLVPRWLSQRRDHFSVHWVYAEYLNSNISAGTNFFGLKKSRVRGHWCKGTAKKLIFVYLQVFDGFYICWCCNFIPLSAYRVNFLWRQEQIPGIVKVKSHEFFINFFTKVVLYELFWWKFSAFNNFCMTCFATFLTKLK